MPRGHRCPLNGMEQGHGLVLGDAVAGLLCLWGVLAPGTASATVFLTSTDLCVEETALGPCGEGG